MKILQITSERTVSNKHKRSHICRKQPSFKVKNRKAVNLPWKEGIGKQTILCIQVQPIPLSLEADEP